MVAGVKSFYLDLRYGTARVLFQKYNIDTNYGQG